jgi:hypothetical protein
MYVQAILHRYFMFHAIHLRGCKFIGMILAEYVAGDVIPSDGML